VAHYFGGVKLGAGGLVRTYTGAIAGALSHATKREHIATYQALIALRLKTLPGDWPAS